MEMTCVGWEPPSRIEWREDDGTDVFLVTYSLEPLPEGGTRLTQTSDATLGAPRMLHRIYRGESAATSRASCEAEAAAGGSPEGGGLGGRRERPARVKHSVNRSDSSRNPLLARASEFEPGHRLCSEAFPEAGGHRVAKVLTVAQRVGFERNPGRVGEQVEEYGER